VAELRWRWGGSGGLYGVVGNLDSCKQVQWAAFCKRLQQEYLPEEFLQVVSVVEAFLSPIASALLDGTSPPVKWIAPGTWR
jgi:hypothetical protein